MHNLRWLRKTAVCALALTAVSFAAMTRTHCSGDEIKPVEKEPEAAAVAIHDSQKAVDAPVPDIVPLEAVEPMPEPEPLYSESELEALALVIYQEAGSDACSDDTRLMVGTVVMNRVADKRFPNTIEGVLLEERQYGRLHWTGLVWPERASRPGEAHAVDRAYRLAADLLDGTASNVLPSDVVYQAEFRQGSETVAESDGFYFCR